jgi:hypothetical protein
VSTRMYLTNAKQILRYVARGCIVLRALKDEGLRKELLMDMLMAELPPAHQDAGARDRR